MPDYDQVLGAHLDEVGVAEPERARARDQLDHARYGADLSSSNRRRELEVLALIRGVHAELALEGAERDRWLVVIAAGRVAQYEVAMSRMPDRRVAPHGSMSPIVHCRKSVTLDDVLDVLRGAADDEVDEVEEDATELPFYWNERGAMIRAIATIASQLRESSIDFIAEIDLRRYEVHADKSGVTCRALFAVASDPAHASRFLELAGIAQATADEVVVAPLVSPPRPKPAPRFDPARPLTTGSAGAA